MGELLGAELAFQRWPAVVAWCGAIHVGCQWERGSSGMGLVCGTWRRRRAAGGQGRSARSKWRRGISGDGGALFLWTKEEEGDPRRGFAISKISGAKLKSKISR
jgi:hypothetical protein